MAIITTKKRGQHSINKKVPSIEKATVLKRAFSFWRNCEGAAAVEFALTFPIYLVAVLLLFEFGRIAYTQAVVIHAAEEATRFAIVNYSATTDEIRTFANNRLFGLDPVNLDAIIVTAPVDPTDQTRLISVEVQYTYVPMIVLGGIFGEGFSDISIVGSSQGFLTEEIPIS